MVIMYFGKNPTNGYARQQKGFGKIFTRLGRQISKPMTPIEKIKVSRESFWPSTTNLTCEANH